MIVEVSPPRVIKTQVLRPGMNVSIIIIIMIVVESMVDKS
jgi:hypothetical protein